MSEPIKNVCLSFSCPERWESFKVDGNTGFCDKCQHSVIDFTQATKAEFNKTLQASSGQVCGRFKASQISREFLKYAAASVIVATSVSACTSENVQPSHQQVQPEAETYEEMETGFMGIVFVDVDTTISENENHNSIRQDTLETESRLEE
jgi:hypothetical protein